MTWYAIYQSSDGRLVSIGEAESQPVIAGMVALPLAGKPDLKPLMWDEATRAFVVRPAKVLVDRLDDIAGNPNYQDFLDAYQALSAANRTKLRNAVIRLLGSKRFRAVQEGVEL
jgi:hypothetical protein